MSTLWFFPFGKATMMSYKDSVILLQSPNKT